jgi:hypothetical protein
MVTRIVAAAVLLAIAVVVAYLLLRPPVEAVSASHPDVSIECSAVTGVSAEACRAWGDDILAQGAPSPTFEMDDLARLAIDRPTFGFGSTCEVEYFISRDPDTPAWREVIACLERG